MTDTSTRPGLRCIGWQPVVALVAGDIIEVTEPNGSTSLRTVYGATVGRDSVVVDLKTRRQVFAHSADVKVFVSGD